MRSFNIHQAKTHLSRLVDEARDGNSFVIAKRGVPVAQVFRIDAPPPQTKRVFGALEGMYTLPDNFEEIDRELDKEIEKLFLGEDEE
ncbi:MAG: type II toxin-antitoxin system prevent-host-death family antitoxin [Terracidiphilus sp.]